MLAQKFLSIQITTIEEFQKMEKIVILQVFARQVDTRRAANSIGIHEAVWR